MDVDALRNGGVAAVADFEFWSESWRPVSPARSRTGSRFIPFNRVSTYGKIRVT